MFESMNETMNRLESILESTLDSKTTAKEIVFHFSDWTDNLRELVDILQNGSKYSDEEIEKVIFVFLSHVPNHLAAAKKLIGLGPVEDIFDVGVLSEDK